MISFTRTKETRKKEKYSYEIYKLVLASQYVASNEDSEHAELLCSHALSSTLAMYSYKQVCRTAITKHGYTSMHFDRQHQQFDFLSRTKWCFIPTSTMLSQCFASP